MDFIELSIQTDPDLFEILTAELAEVGFTSFTEDDDQMQAYITEDAFEEAPTKLVLEKYAAQQSVIYSFKHLPKQNWNAEWESNFQPIIIGQDIYVRADFHEPNASFKYEVIVTPKMSFGTGHHETTSMVMEHQLTINHSGASVLDVGCGTGILAILAEKLGAGHVVAFDNDAWCIENTEENFLLNHTLNATVNLGTIETQIPHKFDIVLANINRNILLAQIPIYVNFMAKGGVLVVSGFFEKDMEDITSTAHNAGLKTKATLSRNLWTSIVFERA